MNGIIDIKAGGKTYSLRFGMMSAEILGQQQLINPSTSSIKILTDLVYSGMANASYLQGETAKSYAECAEIVEQLLEQEDGQVAEIWKVFEESKAGKKLTDAVKKKGGRKK